MRVRVCVVLAMLAILLLCGGHCTAESIRIPASSSFPSIANIRGLKLPTLSTPIHSSFIDGVFDVKSERYQKFRLRQVPGDGGCLFHAISAWLSYLQTGHHLDFDWRMRKLSQQLRYVAIKLLSHPNTTLALENGEVMDSSSLLGMISEVYGLQPSEYCEKVLDPRTWGGGPEIVALSNHFRCPIHVYQLSSDRGILNLFWKKANEFQLELCAKFGSPTFDSKAPIYLLCADGRFPNISPGSQKVIGDHFLAMFPVSSAATCCDASKIDSSSSHSITFQQSDTYIRGGNDNSCTGSWWDKLLLRTFKKTNGAVDSGGKCVCLLSRCPEIRKDATYRDWIHKRSSPGYTNSNNNKNVGQRSWWR